MYLLCEQRCSHLFKGNSKSGGIKRLVFTFVSTSRLVEQQKPVASVPLDLMSTLLLYYKLLKHVLFVCFLLIPELIHLKLNFYMDV